MPLNTMFNAEARAIQLWLQTIQLPPGALILSVASGNKAMRETHQPFIHSQIFQPLMSKGFRCLHHELFPGEGVDISGDLNNREVQHALIALRPNLVICCNLLEHVIDRGALACTLSHLLSTDGYLLVTVPKSFQYHADPIDTYYRPNPRQLASLFPGFFTVHAEVVTVESMWSELRAGGGLGTMAFRLGRHFQRFITLIPQRNRWLSHVHSTLWLIRNRQVTMLLLRKT